MRAADRLERRVLPRLVVAASQVDWPARLGAAARRRAGRQGRLELFFAFDDPCSAVAVLDLAARLAPRRARLVLLPVVVRGLDDDPAVALKRDHALVDARRLARRGGRELARTTTLQPGDTAELAGWVAAAPKGPGVDAFCLAALERLWFTPRPAPDHEGAAALWRAHTGTAPPAYGAAALRRNERRMRRRGPYDTPAAWVHGRWDFAHDRPVQLAGRLDALGWGAP